MQRLKTVILFLCTLAAFSSCDKGKMGYSFTDKAQEQHVLIFYAAASNNLSGLINDNFTTIKLGEVPQTGSKKVLLSFLHTKTEKDSYLQKISRNSIGEVQFDTLLTIPAGHSALEIDVMRQVLSAAHNTYPDSKFTLLFSSHATGWLPLGYYDHPETEGDNFLWLNNTPRLQAVAPHSNNFRQFGPITKSFGAENIVGGTLEMEISELAQAIPMHLSSIIFDACLLGGIEVAYELRNVCDKICFSSAEVPGKGFDYSVLSSALLEDDGSPEAFGKAFYNLWADSSDYGATVSTVVTNNLEPLAQLCKELFEKYRSSIYNLSEEDVQGYYRQNKHYFFDLQDILVKAGISETEQILLQNALDTCISYKDASPGFMAAWGGFTIDTFCGLSMYLPANSLRTDYLDNFYSTYAWNRDTQLVVE